MSHDTVTIELGEPGVSDVVLHELRAAAEDLHVPIETALAFLLGLGIAQATMEGILPVHGLEGGERVGVAERAWSGDGGRGAHPRDGEGEV